VRVCIERRFTPQLSGATGVRMVSALQESRGAGLGSHLLLDQRQCERPVQVTVGSRDHVDHEDHLRARGYEQQ
jgi:hypothetical protein